MENKTTLQHLPELDALRTIAVIMTLLAHFSPVEIPYMWYGVPIFFTLSGFLITTILLKSLNKNLGINRPVIIKNFMIRRILRLFPVYYLFLIFFLLAKKYMGLALWRNEFTFYFFTYTANILRAKLGHGSLACFEHLWSLGVEEQFYLFWPWILLFTPKKYTVSVIILLILLPFIYMLVNYNYPSKDFFLPTDTLGVGALLAFLYTRKNAILNRLKDRRHLLFTISFIHLIIVLIFFKETSTIWHMYREISLCLCTFFIVLVSIYGWNGFIGYFTRNKQVQYIGTISYGIYLYHMPVPYVYRALNAKYFPSVHLSAIPFLLLCFVLTFIIAAFSYKYIETPFLKLKHRFS